MPVASPACRLAGPCGTSHASSGFLLGLRRRTALATVAGILPCSLSSWDVGARRGLGFAVTGAGLATCMS
eukprot:8667544-Alexandrium_andersonii.AAC.1